MAKEQNAIYKQSTDPMYRHNPYIEALPEPRKIEDVANLIRRHPVYSEQERELSTLERTEAVQRISNFMEPMPIHLELDQRFSRMIRNGYFARNPLQAQWLKQFRSAYPEADPRNFESAQPMARSTAAGFAMIGTSGMGKSTAVEYILSLYPQVICHSEYEGQMFSQKQVVWLKLECPHDGSIKGLCKEFFVEVDKLLGTEYFKKFYKSRTTTDDLLPHMALLAARLGLGTLVIDEIQRLNEARSGGATRMLNFFVQLINTIGVPVVLVGTFKAMNLLSSEFSQARRSAGQGDLVWANYQQDEMWEYFVEKLWKYQWTQERVPLTKSIQDMLYEQSQGIPDIAIKLYQIVQWQVIGQEEGFTAGTIRQVAKESLRLVQPILDALRANDTEKLRMIPDIYAPIRDISEYLNRATERIELEGAVNTIRNQQQVSRDDEHSPLVEVAKWLQEAGYDTQSSIECAEMAIARSGDEPDIAAIKKAAFAFALNIAMPIVSEEQTAPKKQRIRTKRLPVDAAKFPGDLRGVLARAASDGLNPFEELSKTGLFETNPDFDLEGDN